MSLDTVKDEILGDWWSTKKSLGFGRSINAPVGTSSANTSSLTLIGPKLLDEFRDLIERSAGVPGHIVEAGVWRGGACIWAAAVLEEMGSDKLVYACDSYEGLPASVHPKDTIDYAEAVSLRVSLEEVEANVKKFGLLHRVVFVKGWFKYTMPSLEIPVSVLRLDGDMYESTTDVLKYMYDRVSPGGFVVVDDYQLPPCKRAVDEFRSRRKIRGGLQVRPGVWWEKPGVIS